MALSDQVDYEECSLVGYTECTTEETTQDLRDDQVTLMSKIQDGFLTGHP